MSVQQLEWKEVEPVQHTYEGWDNARCCYTITRCQITDTEEIARNNGHDRYWLVLQSPEFESLAKKHGVDFLIRNFAGTSDYFSEYGENAAQAFTRTKARAQENFEKCMEAITADRAKQSSAERE